MPKSKSRIIVNFFIFMAGMFFMGLGISLVTKAGLGTSPISSVPYVLSMIFPVTIGQFIFLLMLFFFLVQLLILRRDFPKIQFFQLLITPFVGIFVDLGMRTFSSIDPSNYFEQILFLIIGCALIALGVYLQVIANFIINPGEAIIKVIAMKTRKNFGNVKIVFDFTLLIIAIIISLFAFKSIRGIREGTIICAFIVGTITKLYDAIFTYILRLREDKKKTSTKEITLSE